MARSLVIVESPAKAKTINKYLGRDYIVKASIGHVMDLPKKTIGPRLPDDGLKKMKSNRKKNGKPAKVEQKPVSLDDAKVFEPTLLIINGKGKIINDLRKSANSAEAVYLAGDPDREGEAISAHLALVLSKPSKFIEQEPSVSRFKKKEAAPEELVKKEEENGSRKDVIAVLFFFLNKLFRRRLFLLKPRNAGFLLDELGRLRENQGEVRRNGL